MGHYSKIAHHKNNNNTNNDADKKKKKKRCDYDEIMKKAGKLFSNPLGSWNILCVHEILNL